MQKERTKERQNEWHEDQQTEQNNTRKKSEHKTANITDGKKP